MEEEVQEIGDESNKQEMSQELEDMRNDISVAKDQVVSACDDTYNIIHNYDDVEILLPLFNFPIISIVLILLRS